MGVKLKVGDKIRCVSTDSNDLGITLGSVYVVTGVEGDNDYSQCGGRIFQDGFNFVDDDEDVRYGKFPFDGFEQWELVTD